MALPRPARRTPFATADRSSILRTDLVRRRKRAGSERVTASPTVAVHRVDASFRIRKRGNAMRRPRRAAWTVLVAGSEVPGVAGLVVSILRSSRNEQARIQLLCSRSLADAACVPISSGRAWVQRDEVEIRCL